MTGKLTTIYWRDIPAQVIARSGRTKASVPLPQRFQEAIDRAAQRAGLTSTDDYLAEWRRSDQECTGDLDRVAQDEAARIDGEYTAERLRALVAAGGSEPEAPA